MVLLLLSILACLYVRQALTISGESGWEHSATEGPANAGEASLTWPKLWFS